MSRLARAVSALAVGLIAVIFTASARAESAPASVLWRFQAAAPVSAAPAVASSGNVYLASVEGVLLALAADGHLRWSHGVSGMPVGEPALDSRERVYLATNGPRLYSFHADGRLRWRRQARARIRSGAVWLQSGRILYLGGDQSLFALPSSGEAPDRVLASASGLFTASGMVAAVSSSSKRGPELWRWSGASPAQRWPLPPLPLAGSELQLLAAGERTWLLLAGELHALQPGSSRVVSWSVPARQAAVSADGEMLLVDTGAELRWLNARSGESVYRAPLSEAVSAPPALGNDGVALVPLVSGELLITRPGHVEPGRIRVGSAPLLRPLWREPTGQATVAAGDGALVSLQLRGWPLLEPRRQLQQQPDAAAVARSPESRAP